LVADRFDELKGRIKDRIDIVELIESYLPLRNRGRNWEALCPFHDERTPSFKVFQTTQHYRCFGCGRGGDVFSFVMEREALSFWEAVQRLAAKAGIQVDEYVQSGAAHQGSRRSVLLEAMGLVRDFYSTSLREPIGG
jgi:DNA primase